ncbi:MAG: hypothetical protein ACSLFB_00035 [Acidimicrobiales bacterium]
MFHTILTLVSVVAIIAALVFVWPGRIKQFRIEVEMANQWYRAKGRRHAIVLTLVSSFLPAAVVLSIAIENEVRTGGSRLVNAIGPDSWVTAVGADDWINSSFVPGKVFDRLKQEGVKVSATHRYFTKFNGQDLFVLSYDSPTSFMAPKITSGRHIQNNREAIIDKELKLSLGDTVTLRGIPFQVVGTTSGVSSLGKTAVFIDEKPMLTELAMTTSYTAIAVMGKQETLPRWLFEQPGLQVKTNASFVAGNDSFWARNGSPITTALVVVILTLSGGFMFANKRSQLALNHYDNAALRLIGTRWNTIRNIELQTSLRRAFASTPISFIWAFPGLAVVNEITAGFNAELELKYFVWAAAMVVLMSVVSIALLSPEYRRLSPIESAHQ